MSKKNGLAIYSEILFSIFLLILLTSIAIFVIAAGVPSIGEITSSYQFSSGLFDIFSFIIMCIFGIIYLIQGKSEEKIQLKHIITSFIIAVLIIAGYIYLGLTSAPILFHSPNKGAYSIEIFDVDGTSMLPTFTNGWRLELTPCREDCAKNLERGDFVVFKHGNKALIKRIIGIPGDTIVIENGRVYLNDKELNEPYILTPRSTHLYEFDYEYAKNPKYPYIIIPEHKLFVMGDNRENSEDSRSFGPIKLELIIGYAKFLKYNKAEQRAFVAK